MTLFFEEIIIATGLAIGLIVVYYTMRKSLRRPIRFCDDMDSIVLFQTFIVNDLHYWRLVVNDGPTPDIIVTSDRGVESQGGCIMQIAAILQGLKSPYALDDIVTKTHGGVK